MAVRFVPYREGVFRIETRPATALVVLSASLALTGCSRSVTVQDSSSPSATTSGGATATPSATTGTATVPPQPAAAATPTPVRRPEATATSRLPGVAAAFGKPATFADKVSVTISKIAKSTSAGQGPGAVQGAPVLTFTIEVTNGSSADLTLSNVVVDTAAGAPLKTAMRLYEPTDQDFSGTLPARGTAKATSSFVVPVADRAAVRVTVDLDATHGLATFTGALS